MKMTFMKNRYAAPKKYVSCRVARPNPAVQSGGISAVAIATPAITVDVLSLRVCATMPAAPPKNAMSTS